MSIERVAVLGAGVMIERFIFLLSDDDRDARFDDAGLFKGNLCQSVAEKGFVVEGDRCDHRYVGLVDDIGGIKASAQTHFDQTSVRRMLAEQQESHRGQYLKDGDRLVVVGLGNPVNGV